jgi:hypothetical protein
VRGRGPQHELAHGERGEREDLPHDQRDRAEHGRLGREQQRTPGHRGQRGADHPGRKLGGDDESAQDAEGELADREPGKAHLGRVEGRPVRGGHRGPVLMDHDQDGQADHAGREDEQSPPGGADAAQLQPLHPGHGAEAVATACGLGRAAGQCGGGHHRLPW